MEQLQLTSNAVPLKIGIKRSEGDDLLKPARVKRHLSLETQHIERWNSEERLSQSK